MPKILIIYGSNSSNTYTAARLIEAEFKASGAEVTLLSAAEARDCDLAPYDLVVLGSCTWSKPGPDGQQLQGQVQELFGRFAESLRGKEFPGKKFAVFGLGDSRYTEFCAAAEKIEQLVSDLKGEQVGSPLKVDGLPQASEDSIKAWARDIAQALQPT
jgi:flavodoxin